MHGARVGRAGPAETLTRRVDSSPIPTGSAPVKDPAPARSASPWRNGYVESFNARVRDECLNINTFWSLAQARVVIADWKVD
ncbi:hypothetical protein GCM10028771_09750 [Nocardioides marmoraquaticus]